MCTSPSSSSTTLSGPSTSNHWLVGDALLVTVQVSVPQSYRVSFLGSMRLVDNFSTRYLVSPSPNGPTPKLLGSVPCAWGFVVAPTESVPVVLGVAGPLSVPTGLGPSEPGLFCSLAWLESTAAGRLDVALHEVIMMAVKAIMITRSVLTDLR